MFLHGNPTSSYLWRDVVERVAREGYRCLAVDLIGMGRSGESASGYRLVDHIAHVESVLDALDLRDVIVVGHDWGAVIALDIARRRSERVRAAAFMECHLRPIERWSSLDPSARQLFSDLRTDGVGERMVFEENVFIDVVLPSGILRELTAEEMNAYRAPFVRPRDRAPMLAWAREIPIDGEPADVAAIVIANQRTVADPTIPTLLMHGDPGVLIGADEVQWCRIHGRSMTIVEVGVGTHLLPEDQPGPIADAVVTWSRHLDHR